MSQLCSGMQCTDRVDVSSSQTSSCEVHWLSWASCTATFFGSHVCQWWNITRVRDCEWLLGHDGRGKIACSGSISHWYSLVHHHHQWQNVEHFWLPATLGRLCGDKRNKTWHIHLYLPHSHNRLRHISNRYRPTPQRPEEKGNTFYNSLDIW